jgi:adhesin/invasin
VSFRTLARRRWSRRRWQLFVALAVIAAGAGAAAATGASFVTSSATTTQATTSPVGTDTMTLNGGDGQTAVAGTAVVAAPSVCVYDSLGNPVSGLTVTFTVLTGGGSLSVPSAVTGQDGSASAGSWTLGATVGSNTLRATCAGVSGSPITFTATGIAGPGSKIVLNAGNNQTATAGSAVATAPSVRVTDANSNPVSGVTVTFAAVSGGGSVTGPTQTTNASGIATVGSWRLGATVGPNTLTATSAGLTGSPVGFTATGVAGAASKIAVNAGDGQTVHVGTAVTLPPSVKVTDANNNPVQGISVTFAVTGGGGSITGNSATTDASGIAQVGSWTLGTVAGANTLSASSAGLSGSPVSFTATGLVGSPTTITLNAGNNQTATAGSAVATVPGVRVSDAYNNAVQGVAVTFAATSGGGSVTTTSTTTNSSGIATCGVWTLGTAAGTNTMTATSLGLTGSPVTFTATGVAGAASKYVVTSSGYGPAAGSPVTITAQLADQYNNPVATSGIAVTFTKTGTGGTLGTPNPVNTDASGIATITFTTGTTQGTAYTVTATSTVPSTRTGTCATITTIAAQPTRIAMNAGNSQSATVNTAVAAAPSVVVYDAYNNPVPGVVVTFAVASGGGSITGASATTNASGIATVGSWTLGTIAGANTLTASCAGLSGSPVTFTATGTAGAATRYGVTPSSYSPVARATITLTAQLADQYGNAVATSGITVSWSRTGTGGSFGSKTSTTNASGIATTTYRTSRTAGRVYTFTARSTSPSTRTGTSAAVTTVAGPPTQMALYAGNNQTATVGTVVATAPSVRVRDVNNNNCPNVVVTFAVTAGGGAITTASATTNASGVATCGSWTLGTTVGADTLTATLTGVTGSPVTFTATGVAGAATKYVVTSSSYNPVAGTAVTITAQLVDQYNNPVATSGLAVTFTRAPASGAFSGANPATTNAGGVATITFTTAFTVGTAYTVTAASTVPSARTGTSPTITTR